MNLKQEWTEAFAAVRSAAQAVSETEPPRTEIPQPQEQRERTAAEWLDRIEAEARRRMRAYGS